MLTNEPYFKVLPHCCSCFCIVQYIMWNKQTYFVSFLCLYAEVGLMKVFSINVNIGISHWKPKLLKRYSITEVRCIFRHICLDILLAYASILHSLCSWQNSKHVNTSTWYTSLCGARDLDLSLASLLSCLRLGALMCVSLLHGTVSRSQICGGLCFMGGPCGIRSLMKVA